MNAHWFVFYTKSRQEKKVNDLLVKQGFEPFLPMQRVMRQWSDRKKKVDVPLFNSYIFVRITPDQVPEVLKVPGVAWSVRHNNKPAILRPEELRLIQRFLELGLFLEATGETNLAQGDAVEVADGPLKGMRGTLIRTNEGEKFTVLLESIQQNITLTLDSFILRKI